MRVGGIVPPAAAVVWLVYDVPDYGRVWVVENLPDIPETDIRHQAYVDRVEVNSNADVIATAVIVSVRQGIEALVRYGDDPAIFPTQIEWVEDGVQFTILGPTLTSDQVEAIANSI